MNPVVITLTIVVLWRRGGMKGGGGVRQQNNCPNQVPIVVSCCRCFESVTLLSDGSYMYNSTKLTGVLIQHSLTESTSAN